MGKIDEAVRTMAHRYIRRSGGRIHAHMDIDEKSWYMDADADLRQRRRDACPLAYSVQRYAHDL